MSVKIRVPATTGNVGPGFDAMGLAFTLYGDFTFEKLPAGWLEITGCDPAYANEHNLALRAFRETERVLGVAPTGVRMHIQTDIPISRGLGSSASLLAAGAFAANTLHGGTLDKLDLLAITNRIEGHPDNLAPALFGGLCASAVQDGKPYCAHYAVSDELEFVALIPDFPLSTELARRALPESVSLADAAFNLSRLSILTKALETADMRLLPVALDDRLHQPYRARLIRDYDRVRAYALACGARAMIIGGAGPTLLAVLLEGETAAFLPRTLDGLSTLETRWRAVPIKVDRLGTRVIS